VDGNFISVVVGFCIAISVTTSPDLFAYPFYGVLLDPIVAAGAMSISTVTVVLNALRLNRFR
jgi:cation transport ATPase